MSDYVSKQDQGAVMGPDFFMDDYVTDEGLDALLDPLLFDLHGLDVPDWTEVELDPVQCRGVTCNRSDLPWAGMSSFTYVPQSETVPPAATYIRANSTEVFKDYTPYSAPPGDAESSFGAIGLVSPSLLDTLHTANSFSVITASGPEVTTACITGANEGVLPLQDKPREPLSIGNAIIQTKGRKRHALRCPENGCSHDGTFLRRYELDRHIRAKHRNNLIVACPFHGCLKGVNQTTFSRPDKLTQHIRSVHSRAVDKTIKCPNGRCRAPDMELELLGVHIKNEHPPLWREGDPSSEVCRAISNAASPAYVGCPLWDCRKHVRMQEFQKHLMIHDHERLLSMESELFSMNYLLARGICYCGKSFISFGCEWEKCHCPITGVQILCPVCRIERFEDHKACQDHIDEVHLVAEEHQLHFKKWRVTCLKNRVQWASRKERLLPWKYWLDAKYNTQCPSCNIFVSSHQDHREWLTDPENIKPFRRDILKLYPGFESHPVWDDLKF